MMRLTSQRGVSLMLLIIAITVFAGVALAIVMLLRARYESYPYQVQSYQAYALAHAGVEFAIRYAKDNTNNANPLDANSFMNNPYKYIPQYPTYKDFTFGNGKFSLSYQAGCPDTLYAKGTYGTATREVKLSYFGSYLGQGGSSPYMVYSGVTRTCYGSDCASQTCWNGTSHYTCTVDPYPAPPYSGDRIAVNYCNPSPNGVATWSIPVNLVSGSQANIHLAAQSATGQQVILGRVGFKDNSTTLPIVNGVPTPTTGNALAARWVFDATCTITGFVNWGTNGSGPYCPQAFGGLNPCPLPVGVASRGGEPNLGYGLNAYPVTAYPDLSAVAPFVNCVTNSTSGYYNFPKLPNWTNYPSTPPTLTYPVYWNTSLPTSGAGGTAGTSTIYDATCRPVLPCDPDFGPDSANCSTQNSCNDMQNPAWCPYTNDGFMQWLGPGWFQYAEYLGHYPCFDDAQTCQAGRDVPPSSKTKMTCYWPSSGDAPFAMQTITLDTDLNRLVIETIGHLYPITPVTFYLQFQAQSSGGSTVSKEFIFTVQ